MVKLTYPKGRKVRKMKEKVMQKYMQVKQEEDLWIGVLTDSDSREKVKRAEERLHDLRIERYLLLELMEGIDNE